MADTLELLRERFARAIAAAYGEDFAGTDPILRPAQKPEFGDYQANVAMALAKQVKAKPRDVAAKIIESLDVADVCESPEIAGPGFINLRLTPDFLADQAINLADDDQLGVKDSDTPRHVVVDYSGPNVAKEMHVGHIRSTCIGDSIVRVLEFLGDRVTRQNHLGDWGTQFGMLIEHMADVGAREGEAFHVGDLNALYQQAKSKFDEDADFAERARRRVVALQSGDESTLALWRQLVDESERHFEQVYARLNVRLTAEDVRGESFYNDGLAATAEELERKGVARDSEGALCVFVEQYESPVMVRKSDGGFGYDATDLAAIRFRVGELRADRLIYVTDARQREHFDKVFDAARRAGWAEDVRLDHVPFGTILGQDGKPFKTRAGDVVKLADLLDEAVERAGAIVAEKNPDLSEQERAEVARVVGIGAIKYFDLSSDRVKDYVFDWDRMLAMDGNTAPYLQYAYTRIRSIFRKGGEQGGAASKADEIEWSHPAERALLLKVMQLGGVLRGVADALEPHRLCTYLYELATAFSGFYETCPVLKADTDARRATRLLLCDLTARTLKRGLDLLGIETLERM